MRVREAGAIRDTGNARRVRETYRHGDRAAGKQHRLAQTSGLRRGFEASRDNYSLGVISAKAGMNAIKLIHSIDELRLNGRVLSLKWPTGREQYERY